jgi:undecaprenyl-diphosphatase
MSATTFDRVRRLARSEIVPLLLLVLLAGGLSIFASLADEVREGGTHGFDQRVLLALRNPANRAEPWGPLWLQEVGRDFTALGGIGVLSLLTFAVAGFLLLDGKRRAALLVVIAVGGGLVVATLLKHVFNRPRPELVPHGAYVYTTSFPSGHAMLSAATYLTLGALLARLQPRPALKAFLLGVAMVLTFLVGVSRVYLGVHWPTDVLAGWAAGGVWASLCWLAALTLQRRGQVEKEGERDALS